jgi:exonuclease V gamma subunit
MQVGDYRMVGKLNNCYEQANLFYRYADTKASDVMQAWLHHLLHQQFQHTHGHERKDKETCLITKDTEWDFVPSHPQEAEQHLTYLIQYYLQGQSEPNSLLLPASYAWYKQKAALAQNPKIRTDPMKKAREAFEKKLEYDKHWHLLYRNETSELLLNKQFEAISEALMSPIWEAKKEE